MHKFMDTNDLLKLKSDIYFLKTWADRWQWDLDNKEVSQCTEARSWIASLMNSSKHQTLSSLLFEMGSLTEPRVHHSAKSCAQGTPGTSSLCFPTTGITDVCHQSQFLMWMLGVQTELLGLLYCQNHNADPQQIFKEVTWCFSEYSTESKGKKPFQKRPIVWGQLTLLPKPEGTKHLIKNKKQSYRPITMVNKDTEIPNKIPMG